MNKLTTACTFFINKQNALLLVILFMYTMINANPSNYFENILLSSPTNVLCANPTVQLDEDGQYTFIGSELLQSGIDINTDITFVSANPAIVDCEDARQIIEVIVTAQDGNGNLSTCSSNVTVEDNVLPEISCNDITVSLMDGGGTNIDALEIFEGGTDNCPVISWGMTASPSKVFCSDIGEIPVTLTVRPLPDNDGEIITCTVTVTVVDGRDPFIRCHDITVELDENDGTVTITPEDVDGVFSPVFGDYTPSSDNCGLVSFTLDQTDFDCSHIGQNRVRLTGVDVSGNTRSCGAWITVVDAVAPTEVICNNPTISLDVNGQYTFTGNDVFHSATDACAVTFVSASPESVSCTNVGNSVQVNVTVQDEGGNTATCMSTVTVEDNTAPTVECVNATVTLDDNGQHTFTGSEVFQSGTDACSAVSFVSASPASVNCEDLFGPVQVTVTAQDVAGNTATCTSMVTVEDNVPLQVSCRDTTLTANIFGAVNTIILVNELTEVDLGSCVISYSGLMSPMIEDCSTVGDIPTTITIVTFHDGVPIDTATCVSIITIVDVHPPDAACHDISVVLDANGKASITPEDIDGVIYDGDILPSRDQCSFDNLDLSIDITSFDCNDLGDNIVTLTVIDPSGNSGYCTATVTVEEGNSLPAGWQSTDVGQAGLGNDYSFTPCSQTPEYTITGGGNNAIAVFSDNVAFASYPLCGDGSITAKIENVNPDGYGGLMIREGMDVGAKQVSVFSNMSNNLRFETRYTTNGMKQVNNFFKPSPIWLKLERQGDWIFAYYSSTGYNFQYVHAVSVPMQSCVEFGLASFTYMPGSQTESVFSNVSISGSNGGFSEGGISLATKPSKPSSTALNLNLYPNPNQGQFTLKMNEPLRQAGTLTIYNSYGQQLKQHFVEAGFSQMQIDLGQVPEGLYLLELRDNAVQLAVRKFTISR